MVEKQDLDPFMKNRTSLYQQFNLIFFRDFFFFYKNIYINKKVSSNNHNRENVTIELFCYQNDLNIKTNESWLSFRHRYLYSWSLSLSLRLTKTNTVET